MTDLQRRPQLPNPADNAASATHHRDREALDHEANHLSRTWGLNLKQAHRMMELAFDRIGHTAASTATPRAHDV